MDNVFMHYDFYEVGTMLLTRIRIYIAFADGTGLGGSVRRSNSELFELVRTRTGFDLIDIKKCFV